jgi:hypothetical protein
LENEIIECSQQIDVTKLCNPLIETSFFLYLSCFLKRAKTRKLPKWSEMIKARMLSWLMLDKKILFKIWIHEVVILINDMNEILSNSADRANIHEEELRVSTPKGRGSHGLTLERMSVCFLITLQSPMTSQFLVWALHFYFHVQVGTWLTSFHSYLRLSVTS